MTAKISSITQMNGIFAAHVTHTEHGTGCTVIVCPEGAHVAVDVRGGAPATRETDLLRPEETVELCHAVVLSGGSAYGLEASCGVARELERRGIGLDVGVGVVPIVSGACLFDLACGDPSVRPSLEDGAQACARALDEPGVPLEQGCVGAGTGCTVGKLKGAECAMKSGLGENIEYSGDLMCAAIAAVNACGDIVDPDTGAPIAGILQSPRSHTLASTTDILLNMQAHMPLERTNTTISCVVTNAKLNKAQALKVAQIAADGYAHAIRPTHTTNDGDAVFVMATGELEAPVDVVGVLATRALERAIVQAAVRAQSAYGFIAACDL